MPARPQANNIRYLEGGSSRVETGTPKLMPLRQFATMAVLATGQTYAPLLRPITHDGDNTFGFGAQLQGGPTSHARRRQDSSPMGSLHGPADRPSPPRRREGDRGGIEPGWGHRIYPFLGWCGPVVGDQGRGFLARKPSRDTNASNPSTPVHPIAANSDSPLGPLLRYRTTVY